MTLRWYGSKFDTVTLKQIRQIPGVTGVITTLYDTAPGEVWSRERIKEMKDEVEKSGLHVSGIESVNVHDAIKVGTSDRDKYIDNYIETLENLGKEDIHLVCYNFMPVFDWTRSELARKRPDGSTVLAYNQDDIDKIVPEKMFESISKDMNGTVMPGWEPERMEKVKELFEMYKDVDDEKLFENLKYFLETMETGHGQGKKLGFIAQEMGREINTLGSKSNHADMQKIVVRMKDELEQIKEQVLNVL